MRYLLFFFSLLLFSVPGNSYGNYGAPPLSHYPRHEVAYSLTEALQRPSCIRVLYLWPLEEMLVPFIPELVNLEVLVFGFDDGEIKYEQFAFPEEFCRLPKLREVSIINSSTVTAAIGEMHSLRKLNFH